MLPRYIPTEFFSTINIPNKKDIALKIQEDINNTRKVSCRIENQVPKLDILRREWKISSEEYYSKKYTILDEYNEELTPESHEQNYNHNLSDEEIIKDFHGDDIEFV